jgi:hypothetical protein
MAYEVHYWQREGKREDEMYSELKCVRIKSKGDVVKDRMVESRPSKTNMVTMDRSDRQSNIEQVLWKD